MEFLTRIYRRRFPPHKDFRNKMYKVLCQEFFQKYIPKSSTVLDIATGYCEFINNIQAKKKIALDLNRDAKNYAKKGVEVIISSSTNMKKVKSNSIDVAYVSNFFEHLSKEDISITMGEICRVLKKKGKILVLQPNIKYCYKDYWCFFDHITPLDDRSLAEALEINGFKVLEVIPRFLPYSMQSKLPKSLFLVKLYVKVPLLWRFFGKQAFLYAEKL